MIRLSRPVTVGAYTLYGVDDWLCFCTDRAGRWHYFATECSPMWPKLPRCFDGPYGYPDSDEGVFATAFLEAAAGMTPHPVDPDCVDQLAEYFTRATPQ
jgi:hypothetical protein